MVLVRENYRGEEVSQTGTARITGGRNLYFKVKSSLQQYWKYLFDFVHALVKFSAFQGCVPSNFVMEERNYALYSTFEDDFDVTPLRSPNREALLSKLFV